MKKQSPEKGALSGADSPRVLRRAVRARRYLEHLTLETLAYGWQKPACSHFVARIFRKILKILAKQLTHCIRKLP